MFKFMKSKKGFTLVELMIVVVIMAILVAVAVPIFSAVTKNARTKTCLANQREIQSQLNNAEMSDVITIAAGDKYTLTTNGDADGGSWAVSTTATGDKVVSVDKLNSLFQKVPYCPIEGNAIEVSITASGIGGETDGFKVTTTCTKGTKTATDVEVHN
jgi:prepilin-type N-terminal cleavage/methylation domain-containing protein